ncbi:flagellar hook-associated protein FlgL [Natribacillus halophilus]|uniref:Flagellar hook-associated protein 3 FlgL n=1 Tax=Natribacillus halophilus TaxID=549003 RepID=A0A1G8KNR2_9BACI|nr:flagellar hook-associated protein FlgL [Natribacillus halophilus]SDI45043.1 flagellar hook-associated protein 3 FlgL [Natribacillus halophilus]
MRVTQSMISSQTLTNIQNNYGKLANLQEQLSTGKKINRPSQDPVAATSAMQYHTELRGIEQFQRNTSEANAWLESTDSALDTVNQALQRIREMTVQASNDTYDETQRMNMAEEVGQLITHIEDLANTQVNNKYIFNGTDSRNPPVNLAEETFPTDTDTVTVELMAGVEVPINVEAGQVFGEDMFADLRALENKLMDPETSDEELDAFLTTIDSHVDETLRTEAEVGARMNRVAMIEDRLAEQNVIATRIMSDNEDADIAEVITELVTRESVHQASFASGARIIQPSLIDFLS